MAPAFALGAAANYAVLFEGGASNTLTITNVTTNVTGSGAGQGGGIGNVGVGGAGRAALGSQTTINGSLDFSAANTGQFTNSNPPSNVITGGVTFNVSAVAGALNTVNALNTTLGALPGTNVAVNGNTTINASGGTFSASGTGYTNVRVFNVTSFSLGNGQTLTINGDPNGDSVVLNFTGATNFNGNVVLTGGLTPDNVVFNFVGGSNLTGGPGLSINNGAGATNLAQGIFLDPNGSINVNGANVLGRVFGGDSAVFNFDASNVTAPVSRVTPTLTTTPNPTAVTLSAATPPVLTDSATLAGGNSPTGTLTFTLFVNGGTTPVDTETVTVKGNGTYTTPTGFTLPATGTVTGTYQWDASYSGDANNNAVSDNNARNEQVIVSAASPTLSTTPSPAAVTLMGTATVTLTDSASLAGGFRPGGTITFTLFKGGTLLDTESVAVSGNGTYATPTGFTLPATGTVTGTYQWDASYSGDGNNTAVSDNNAANEQVTVSPSTPTLSTTPSPAAVTLGATPPPVLTDSANLDRTYHGTGTITFTLFKGGALLDTETVTVTGNGTYTTPTGFTLPATGTVTGTYQWDASYSGDGNNTAVSDNNAANEQVTVSAASPALSTTPSPAAVTLGAAAPPALTDSATLAGGFHPAGTITFTLFFNGGATPVDTETVAVGGNGTYTTPTGFTLPATGTVAGSYQWDATYTGDPNNNPASDNNAANERITVSAASPTLSTTPSPGTVTLGTTAVTLKDSASLAGGFRPGGTITFTLFKGSTLLDTESVAVSGNGTYATPTGFTLPATGPVTGTYQWDATYSGDPNNNPAADNNAANEQVTVSAASPTLTTTPIPSTVTLGTTAVTLKDSADLEGGFRPTGTITFRLLQGATVLDTETVTANGNGTYATPTGFTLPTTGTVAGTYQWAASYGGDGNNNPAATDRNEQVTVSAASPTLATTPNPTAVALGTTPVTLTDAATLSGGYFPTGTITFTLFKGGTLLDTESVAVSGNGTYTTPTGFTLPATGTVTGTYQWDASYSGDGNNTAVSDNNAANEQVTVSAASPALSTTPSPAAVTLGAAAPPALTDSATLAGGFHPAGTITFTLFFNGGATPVDTETVAVGGNGTYTTPTGFTLPATGTVAGSYQWDATYTGDPNNNPASDNGASNEQVTVSAASPTLSTSPSPAAVTLGPNPVTLTDTATLTGGYRPTGTVTFTLFLNGGSTPVDTERVTASGNGTYTTPTGFTLPTTGTAAGVYQWDASYSGDANNNAASDNNDTTERVTVSAASPTVVTTASPATVALPAPVPTTLSDSAVLAGGSNPTGSIVFTLTGPGNFSFTQTDPVSGNATYTASTTLPTTGTVAGTYTWTARYGGDANNNGANDQGGPTEQTVVGAASLSLVTVASPNVTLPTGPSGTVTLSDKAFLSGGDSPTGSIAFTLTGPGGFSFTQTDPVSGNGAYTASTTLPTTGAVAGTYTWTARYGGDANNNGADDQGGTAEQTVVRPASPTLATAAGPEIRRGIAPPTLTDTAVLSGGFFPTGSIAFTLTGPGGFFFTQTDTVTGNGAYSATATLPTTGQVAGTYTWTAHYGGDANNSAADDQGGAAEQVTVPQASPTLVTTAGPATVTLPAPAPTTLSDSAALAGGLNPTGSITFTLTGPGGFSFTEDVTVMGNATYTASTTLPTAGTVAGTYTWTATYGGDTNNDTADDQGGPTEQTVVSAAGPGLTTTPNPSTVPLGGRLQDVAVLAGGFDPTGSITFKLYAPGVDPTVGPAAFTETVTVNGDGTYHTTAGFVSNATGTWHWVAAYGGDPNNNPAASGPLDEPVTIPRQADLVLTKVAEPGQVVMGLPVTYTLTVHNLGPDTATNVVVDDPFPAGVILVGPFLPSQGTFDPAAGVWTVGTLPGGAGATLVVGAQVQTLGPVTNSATARADQFDPDLSNNTAVAVVTGMRPADMITKQFFLDSFDPPAAAVFAGGRVPAAAAGPGAGAGAVNGVGPSPVQRSADPAGLGGLFNSLVNGGAPPQAPNRFADPAGPVPSPAGGPGSGPFGPAYGDTLGGPAGAGGMTARTQLLAGGGSAAEVALGTLTNPGDDPRPAAGLYAQFLYRAADPAGAAGRADDLRPGAADDLLATAFGSADESSDPP